MRTSNWIMKPKTSGTKIQKTTWVATTWQPPFVTSDLDFSGHFWLRTLKFPHGRLLWIQILIPGDSSRGLLIPNLEVTNNLWVRVTNHHPKKGRVESPGSFTLESRTLRLSCRVYFRGFRMSLLEKFTTITASSGCYPLQLPGFCCLCSSGVPFWWTIFHVN